MALPGENSKPIIPPQRWRIAIGETYQHNGQTLPRKLDYFSIRHLSVQAGSAPVYVLDQAMQAALCKAVGVTEKPTVVPVSVIGNPIRGADGTPKLPDSILWSRMAYYSGGRAVCCCSEFDANGKGTATRRRYDKHIMVDEATLTCDPLTCPYATGTHSIAKYKDVALCKPQVVAVFSLPWAPVVGSVAKLKTTGWHNYAALRNSLLSIAAQTGGWLHDLPLWLVLAWERASNGKMVPAVRVEYRGSVAQLRDTAVELQRLWLGQETQIKQLSAGITEVVTEDERSAAEQAATQVEFYPESVAPAADAEFELVGEPELEPVVGVAEGDGGGPAGQGELFGEEV